MTVVLVHGVPQTHRLWSRLIAALDRDDEIVALDLPGFAEPAPASWRGTKEDYLGWLLDELEQLAARDGPVHLVGHDWGCLLVLRAASLRPELLRSVAAGNGPIDENWPLHGLWRVWNVPGAGERLMDELTQDAIVPLLVGAGIPEEDAPFNAWATPGNKELTLTLYRSAVNVGREWGPDLAKIVVPSMLVWGERDLIVPVEFGRRMAARMGAELVTLDAQHFWPAERPVEAAAALQRHWRRAESSSQTILTQSLPAWFEEPVPAA